MNDLRPIIVTLQLDATSQRFFDEKRKLYFPPAINYIPAHLTLFHQLPGAQFETILNEAAEVCSQTKVFDIEIAGLLKLGRGVAYHAPSPALQHLREGLVERFDKWLIKQDRQKFRPHITIQNKVAPHEAIALRDHLAREFQPFRVRGEGLQLWRYENGPWAGAGALAFVEN